MEGSSCPVSNTVTQATAGGEQSEQGKGWNKVLTLLLICRPISPVITAERYSLNYALRQAKRAGKGLE